MVHLIRRSVAFALLWWIAAEGRLEGWAVGFPVVVAAAAISLKLRPARKWRLHPLASARLLVYFLYQAVAGGVDVARRALLPRMPLAPVMLQYPTRLPLESARLLLVNTLNLLPGTLIAELDEDRVVLHALDSSLPIERMVRELEERIAPVFGCSLAAEAR